VVGKGLVCVIKASTPDIPIGYYESQHAGLSHKMLLWLDSGMTLVSDFRIHID